MPPRPVIQENSLASLHPNIAAQWHPTKNGDLTPAGVSSSYREKVWWRCPNGPDHEWATRVSNRVHVRTGCPFCAKQRLSVTNSLAALSPNVAAQWHPTRNGDASPDQVIDGSDKRYWWKCPEGTDHEWIASVGNRTQGRTGCPFCSGLRASITNSLLSLAPDLAAQWDPNKNAPLTPAQVVARSGRRVWWQCARNPSHSWHAQIASRFKGSGCPGCFRPSGRHTKPRSLGRLSEANPALAAEWHPKRNGMITPEMVSAGSSTKVWWQCPAGPEHEWQASVVSRAGNATGNAASGQTSSCARASSARATSWR